MTTPDTHGTTADRARPAADAPAPPTPQDGFAYDVQPTSIREAIAAYVGRVRGGQVGALPALFGLIVLGIIFWQAHPAFLTNLNLVNLTRQGAPIVLIAMGLVFVLLLGEIDLSAGTASGVCAGLMAVAAVTGAAGNSLRERLGTGVWLAFVIGMVVAAVLSALARLWIATLLAVVGAVLLGFELATTPLLALILAVATGTSIGVLTGSMVSRIGIPSFVVTLALFLAWQGALLFINGNANATSTRQFGLFYGISNRTVPPMWGWIGLIALLGFYTAYTVLRSMRRARAGLVAESMPIVLARAGVLWAIGLVAMYFFNQNRGRNTVLEGVPWIVPIIIFLMIGATLLLTKTRYGRHVYAVGGNREAARRAGIDVERIRMSVFVIGSTFAAFGGIAAASYLGSVPSNAGGGNTLLFSVGAAVIGGTSLFGGRGRVRDAVIGGFVIAIIPNGLGLLGLGAAPNFIITGIVLLLAASVDAISRKRVAASGAA